MNNNIPHGYDDEGEIVTHSTRCNCRECKDEKADYFYHLRKEERTLEIDHT